MPQSCARTSPKQACENSTSCVVASSNISSPLVATNAITSSVPTAYVSATASGLGQPFQIIIISFSVIYLIQLQNSSPPISVNSVLPISPMLPLNMVGHTSHW